MLKNFGIVIIFLSIIDAIYYRPIADIILNKEKLRSFLLRSGTRQRVPLSLFLFDMALAVLNTAIRQDKNKRHPNWNGRSKIISVVDTILY